MASFDLNDGLSKVNQKRDNELRPEKNYSKPTVAMRDLDFSEAFSNKAPKEYKTTVCYIGDGPWNGNPSKK